MKKTGFHKLIERWNNVNNLTSCQTVQNLHQCDLKVYKVYISDQRII